MMPVTIMVNRKMINFSSNVKIIHNGQVTIERIPDTNEKIIK